MSKQISVARAIFEERCPRCRDGKLFKSSGFKISSFYKMNQKCTVCAVSFNPEPGFYFGAMYISYAFLVGVSIMSWLLLYFAFKPAFQIYLIVVLSMNVLLLPFIFRYSRTLFLYGFGGIRFVSRKDK